MDRRIGTTAILGGALLAFGGMTALRPERVREEPAPMEAMALDRAASWDIAPTRNEAVDRWIEFLSERNADKTRLWMERSGKYAPMIRAQLRARGMPEDLLYLAFIESGFTPKAYSSAAASGIWQFIAETGRRYGLEVSSEVDERRDPLKSTSAALDYLQELYDRFGSWYLAAAAYNTGENRVARLMREHTGSERGVDADFWKIAPDLPRETRNYVPLMLAAGFVDKAPAEHGFADVAYQAPLQFEVAWVPGGTPLSVVAEAAGVDETDVKDLNTHLMQGRAPAKRGWAVRIPSGSKVAFERNFQTLLAAHRVDEAAHARRAAATTRKHTIRRGETLGGIAKKYGVTVSAITSANSGLDARRLIPGKVVRVPVKSATTGTASASGTIHIVKKGESLSVIAERYDLTVSSLKRVNGLAGNRIQPGQKLRVRV